MIMFPSLDIEIREQIPAMRLESDPPWVVAGGAFDPLHLGHLMYLASAARGGRRVLVAVTSDFEIRLTKGREPLLGERDRRSVVESLQGVTSAEISYDGVIPLLEAMHRQFAPIAYVKGDDWKGRMPEDQVAACARLGIPIEFTPTGGFDSSSRLLKQWSRAQDTAALDRFARVLAEQQPTNPDAFTAEYFTGAWRGDGQRYTLENRRRIEGKHPRLILDTFKPDEILDAGCGPNGLFLRLLAEAGHYTSKMIGLDIAAPIIPRPDEVLCLLRADIAGTSPLFRHRGASLVICREVLEHLTIHQIRRAVRNLVRWSTRYIYVTTRFHPDPWHLLDVASHADRTDPTEISYPTKDFLRLLFLLEGCQERPDLEAKMDWQQKGRCLVFEKEDRRAD